MKRLMLVATATILVASAGSLPARAQADTTATATADEQSLQKTSLRMVIGSVVADVRNRLLNTINTVSWPVLPQEDADLKGLTQEKPSTIPNREFKRLNNGSFRRLPEQNPVAAQIARLLKRGMDEPSYLKELFFAGLDPFTAAQVTLDRRRALNVLEQFGGAQLTILVNNKEFKKTDTLTWFFEPYKGTVGNLDYYRFRIHVVAENQGIAFDPAAGAKQTVRVEMTLLPDENLPSIRPSGGTISDPVEVAVNTEAKAEQLGGGENNPLLLAIGVPSFDALARQVGGAILTTGKVSALTGVVVSSKSYGNKTIAGLNALLSRPGAAGGEPGFGIAAGLSGDTDLYVGPSASVGDGALILSAGALFPKGRGTRVAGTVSVDLSRLLFGKPKVSEERKELVFSPQQIAGLNTSKEVLSGSGALVFENGPPEGKVNARGGGFVYNNILLDKAGRGVRLVVPSPVNPRPEPYQITVQGERGDTQLPATFLVEPGAVVRVNLNSPTPSSLAPAPPSTDAVVVPLTAAAPPATPTGNLRLQVYTLSDNEGIVLLPDALVQASRNGKLLGEGRTGANGRIELLLPPGNYAVRISLKGFRTQEKVKNLAVTPGGRELIVMQP